MVPPATSADHMVTDPIPTHDFSIGVTPSLAAFRKSPATCIYWLFPYQEVLSSYAMGIFNAINWDNEHSISKGNELEHYLTHAIGLHPDKISSWIPQFKVDNNTSICNAMLNWLVSNKTTFLSPHHSLAFSLSKDTLKADTPDKAPSAPQRPSFVSIVTAPVPFPHGPSCLLPVDKPCFKAAMKGTQDMCIYSCVPPLANKQLLSCCHSNDNVYRLVMSELSKHARAASLLAYNPVTQVSWSANGQFIMVHFKDKVNDPVYELFTNVFSSIYGTNIDQEHYLQAESSSIVKWTSCPTFNDTGKAISAAQYLEIIKSSSHFKDIDIIGLPKMIISLKSKGDAYCMLKLQF